MGGRHVPGTGFWNGASTLKQHFVLPKNGSKYYLKYTFLVFPVLGIFGLRTSLVGGGYIDSISRGKPMAKEGVDKIEREVNDFHSERMNSPPKTCSLQYWAQASLRYPIVAQAARKYHCIPTSSATSERSFSKSGHIVRARRTRLLDEHVKELSFLSWNQDLMY